MKNTDPELLECIAATVEALETLDPSDCNYDYYRGQLIECLRLKREGKTLNDYPCGGSYRLASDDDEPTPNERLAERHGQ